MPKPGPDVPLCGAHRPKQPPDVTCTMVAGWGTDHLGIGRCKRHGGTTPTHTKSAAIVLEARAIQDLRELADRLGVPREVDPAQGILELVWEAAGNVEFYRQLVSGLPSKPTAGEEGDIVGIYLPTYHATGLPTGHAKPHIFVVLYNEERDRLARFVKAALDAKIDERRVRLAEATARDLFESVGRAMKAAQLSPKQAEEFRRALTDDLRRADEARRAEPAQLTS